MVTMDRTEVEAVADALSWADTPDPAGRLEPSNYTGLAAAAIRALDAVRGEERADTRLVDALRAAVDAPGYAIPIGWKKRVRTLLAEFEFGTERYVPVHPTERDTVRLLRAHADALAAWVETLCEKTDSTPALMEVGRYRSWVLAEFPEVSDDAMEEQRAQDRASAESDEFARRFKDEA